MGSAPPVTRVYGLLPALWEICLSAFLLTAFESGSGSWDDGIFCTLFGDTSLIHGVIQYYL